MYKVDDTKGINITNVNKYGKQERLLDKKDCLFNSARKSACPNKETKNESFLKIHIYRLAILWL
jgi:hypothetical protein